MAAEICSFRVLPTPELTQPPADRRVVGDPQQSIWNVYSDPTLQFHVGRWSSDVGSWRVQYSETEFCHMLAGRVRIESESGQFSEFESGDSFVVPAGFRGVWAVIEPATKLYAIFEPQLKL
jgi:uncharacterized protein